MIMPWASPWSIITGTRYGTWYGRSTGRGLYHLELKNYRYGFTRITSNPYFDIKIFSQSNLCFKLFGEARSIRQCSVRTYIGHVWNSKYLAKAIYALNCLERLDPSANEEFVHKSVMFGI